MLKSFGDLLLHPHPPLELLRTVKTFGKRCQQGRGGVLPVEIATVLYFAAIVAALLKCEMSITSLSETRLNEGVIWALDQSWIEGDLRALFEAGRERLSKAAPVRSRKTGGRRE